MTISELSIKRPILVIVTFLAITIIGLFAYTQLKYETFPNMTVPVVAVVTRYNNASASVVESTVTRKIEDVISGVNNVESIRSMSSEGASLVIVELANGADVDVALRDIQNKVNRILDSLPDDASQPTFSKFSNDDRAVMSIGVTSNMNFVEFSTFLSDYIEPELSKASGVAQINLIGNAEREIQVNVDSQKLQAYRISNSAIAAAIKNANLDYPTGNVKDQDGKYTVRLSGTIKSIEQLKNLVIKSSADGQVLLSDVADIKDGSEERTTICRVNGVPSIGLQIFKQSDANQVEVCNLVREKLNQLEAKYQSKDLKFTIIQDSSNFTMASVKAVKEDLLIAVFLVALVMLVFLHSLRNAVIVMVAIPTSLVTALIGMWITNCTMNIISLLAMSLVIGILVDDSIVVLENIHSHLEKGEEPKVAALNGRNEIGMTAVSITMVDVVVFLPLSLVSGIIGALIHQFALVIVLSTLVSLFVSFTVTPMLASRFSKAEKLSDKTLMGRFGLWFEAQYAKLVDSYLNVLNVCLKHRGKVLILSGLIFIATVALVPAGFVGSEFMSTGDMGELTVEIELPARAKLEQTALLTQKAEDIIKGIPEVDKVFSNIGGGGGMAVLAPSNSAELTVMLVPKEDRKRTTDEVVNMIKDKLDVIPGMTVHVTGTSIMGGSYKPIQYVVTGVNWDKVYQGALQVKEIMTRVPGTKDIELSTEAAMPEVQIHIDRDKMAQFGLTMSDVGSVLYGGYTGNTNSKFRDPETGEEYNIRVRYDQIDRSSTDDVGAQTFVNAAGEVIQLSQFATLTNGLGANKLDRQDRNYSITVSARAVGLTPGAIAQEIKKLLMQTELPDGVDCKPGGMLKQQNKAFGSLGLALLAAIIFVYLVMTALYNSFIYPFVVLFSIPLAVIGAILALALTNNSLSIFSILGMIMLVGLVAKNAILLVDFANRAREEGANIKEALIEAGRERIRPILMTTLTMILGMLPLATATSYGSEFKRGLGWALVGGLTSSMLLTLVVVPVVYSIVEQVREWVLRKNHKMQEAKGQIN